MDIREDKGVTFIELMVVIFLLAFILAAAIMAASAAYRMLNTLSAQAVATDEAQTFEDQVARELRQANNQLSLTATQTSNADAQGAFLQMDPRGMTFYIDLQHTGQPYKGTVTG